MFDDIPGVEVVRDDILIAGKDVEEHDAVLRKVLDRALERGLGLNSEKCRIAVDFVTYQGHIFSDAGVKVDPAKVSVIQDFPTPENIDDVTRWLGMVKYVSKFIPNLFQIIRGKKLPAIYSLLMASRTFLLGTIFPNLLSTPNCRMTRQVRL